jgi:hypothetical protein
MTQIAAQMDPDERVENGCKNYGGIGAAVGE